MRHAAEPPSITNAYYNSEIVRPHCSVIRERYERISELLLCRFIVALLSLLSCMLLLHGVLVCVCVFLLPPYLL